MPRSFLIGSKRYGSASLIQNGSIKSSSESSDVKNKNQPVKVPKQQKMKNSNIKTKENPLPPGKVIHKQHDAVIPEDPINCSSLVDLTQVIKLPSYQESSTPPPFMDPAIDQTQISNLKVIINFTPPSTPFQNQPKTTTSEMHSCPDCGKKYSTSSNLTRHRQTHRSVNDKKAKKCPHCDKIYVSIPAYSMHILTHTQGCRCSFCGKCFSRPWLLQGHIRTHTGEKPFICHICNKAFADKSNLRAHLQTHSSEKPFMCQRCGKRFALKSYLYKHEELSCSRDSRESSTGGGRHKRNS